MIDIMTILGIAIISYLIGCCLGLVLINSVIMEGSR